MLILLNILIHGMYAIYSDRLSSVKIAIYSIVLKYHTNEGFIFN